MIYKGKDGGINSQRTELRFTPISSFWSPLSVMAANCAVLCAKSLQSCPTFCNPKDCSPPGSSIHGILQVRILEWVAISFSRGCLPPRDQTHISKVSWISVQFSRSVVSDSLQPHGPQHARPPCPSPTPGVYPNSCPLSRWCHPTTSSSVVPFSSCLQSFPASGSFQMS